jgi:hypothetical protein
MSPVLPAATAVWWGVNILGNPQRWIRAAAGGRKRRYREAAPGRRGSLGGLGCWPHEATRSHPSHQSHPPVGPRPKVALTFCPHDHFSLQILIRWEEESQLSLRSGALRPEGSIDLSPMASAAMLTSEDVLSQSLEASKTREATVRPRPPRLASLRKPSSSDPLCESLCPRKRGFGPYVKSSRCGFLPHFSPNSLRFSFALPCRSASKHSAQWIVDSEQWLVDSG